MIQTRPPDCPNHSLNIRILPGGPGCNQHLFDIHCINLSDEFATVIPSPSLIIYFGAWFYRTVTGNNSCGGRLWSHCWVFPPVESGLTCFLHSFVLHFGGGHDTVLFCLTSGFREIWSYVHRLSGKNVTNLTERVSLTWQYQSLNLPRDHILIPRILGRSLNVDYPPPPEIPACGIAAPSFNSIHLLRFQSSFN